MSRVGKKIIDVPQGVTVDVSDREITTKGPKGLMKRTLHSAVKVVQDGNHLSVVVKNENEAKQYSNIHGLTRALVNNMVLGVSQGFEKRLMLIGVGYRAAVAGKTLNLTLGYSHPINFEVPEGIEVKVAKPTEISVHGVDKEIVGQVAAEIRGFRPPEPYHGKGVRYADEVIVTKVGKSGGKK